MPAQNAIAITDFRVKLKRSVYRRSPLLEAAIGLGFRAAKLGRTLPLLRRVHMLMQEQVSAVSQNVDVETGGIKCAYEATAFEQQAKQLFRFSSTRRRVHIALRAHRAACIRSARRPASKPPRSLCNN
eukprot:4646320-Pleurochrysis_carterae.AAC.1